MLHISIYREAQVLGFRDLLMNSPSTSHLTGSQFWSCLESTNTYECLTSSIAVSAAVGLGSLTDRLFRIHQIYSSSLLSSSSAAAAFLAGFFFLLAFFFTSFASGCSRILRISSSVIFLSLLILDRSSAGGAAIFCRPFLVIARN